MKLLIYKMHLHTNLINFQAVLIYNFFKFQNIPTLLQSSFGSLKITFIIKLLFVCLYKSVFKL